MWTVLVPRAEQIASHPILIFSPLTSLSCRSFAKVTASGTAVVGRSKPYPCLSSVSQVSFDAVCVKIGFPFV